MLTIQLFQHPAYWSWKVYTERYGDIADGPISGTAADYHDACRDALVAYEQRKKETQG